MITILTDYNLLIHNTFRVAARCMKWIEYTSEKDLFAIAKEIKGEKYFSIGEGSNILFTGNYEGIILHSSIPDFEIEIRSKDEILLKVGAGLILDDIIEKICGAGYWGMENLSGIPGTVGASVVQNVGAYGTEIKDVVERVECYDLVNNRFISLNNTECNFSYRHSLFKEEKKRYIVTKVVYRLRKDSQPNLGYSNLSEHIDETKMITPTEIRNLIIKIRNQKLPSVDRYGSAGSFFKNPILSREEFKIKLEQAIKHRYIENEMEFRFFELSEGVKIPAAWLIEKCGFKGYRFGNAGVWEKQPLVIYNRTGRATSDEIISLEKLITDEVYSKFGIKLEPEVEHI